MTTYIMRWNPTISSSTIEGYNEAREKWPDGFQGNWSIYDWEQADVGDKYVMMRVGEGPNGIVYLGTFLSEPYGEQSWSDKYKVRMYVDLTIEHPADPDHPILSLKELTSILPEIDWAHGHSGEPITQEQATKLWAEINKKIQLSENFE